MHFSTLKIDMTNSTHIYTRVTFDDQGF